MKPTKYCNTVICRRQRIRKGDLKERKERGLSEKWREKRLRKGNRWGTVSKLWRNEAENGRVEWEWIWQLRSHCNYARAASHPHGDRNYHEVNLFFYFFVVNERKRHWSFTLLPSCRHVCTNQLKEIRTNIISLFQRNLVSKTVLTLCIQHHIKLVWCHIQKE